MRTKSEQSLYVHMVYVSCCLLLWIFCVCSIEIAEGRRITEEDFLPDFMTKRNSWWSKKSLDNNPEYQNEISTKNDKSGCYEVLDIFKQQNKGIWSNECYSQLCVPDFVACSRSDDDVYNMCKVEHDLCADRCFTFSSDSLQK